MTGLHTWMRGDQRARRRALAVVVCVGLLALLTLIQVAHVDPVNADADHCPLCIVLHTTVPVAVAAAIIVLVEFEVLVPAAEIRPVRTTWQQQLFIRPPPSA